MGVRSGAARLLDFSFPRQNFNKLLRYSQERFEGSFIPILQSTGG